MYKNQHLANELILTDAIEALYRETGVYAEIQDTQIAIKGTPHIADASIRIGKTKGIFVEVKRHAQHINIGSLINQIHRLPGTAVLAADYINPKMADKLKKENVQFIDTAGNAFINLKPIYVFVTGKKQETDNSEIAKGAANRAFEPKGLLVTYAILVNPQLINEPYRVIADTAGVALGTVGWVLKALKAGGFTDEGVSKKTRRVRNPYALLDRWVTAWPEKLKPKYRLGTFASDDPDWWKNTNIEKYEGLWGGETAAAIYTNYLKPQITTAYISKNQQANLITDFRLRKVKNIDHDIFNGALIELYEPFWHFDNSGSMQSNVGSIVKKSRATKNVVASSLVHPILTYADLIATGDARNLEAARMLYDDRIAQLDWEN